MKPDTRLIGVLIDVTVIDDAPAFLAALGTLQPPHVAFSDQCLISTDTLTVNGAHLPISALASRYAHNQPATIAALHGNGPGHGRALRHRINEQATRTWGITLDTIYTMALTALMTAIPAHQWPLIAAYTTATAVPATTNTTVPDSLDRLVEAAGYQLTPPQRTLRVA